VITVDASLLRKGDAWHSPTLDVRASLFPDPVVPAGHSLRELKQG